ncbi:helix-turn-helix domain-containing protein [Aeoliella sp.]|uniref:helix-turn-helix domain-containing protein n=1 Tax=Aeoliella sp. TaxID=2795800 RepID=UPI003CCC0829
MEARFSTGDVASKLSVSRATVFRFIRSGRLSAENVAAPGKRPRYVIHQSGLDEFLASCPSSRPATPRIRRYKRTDSSRKYF